MSHSRTRDVSTSPSEGEIVESDSDKANSTTNKKHGTSVDRQSRHAVASSRSPSPYRASNTTRTSTLGRKRSASPYRHSRHRKRHHGEDRHERPHNELRRFKVHYEESRRVGDGGLSVPRRTRGDSDRKQFSGNDDMRADSLSTRHDRARRGFAPSFSVNSTVAQGPSPQSFGSQHQGSQAHGKHTYIDQRPVSNHNGDFFSSSNLKHVTEPSGSKFKHDENERNVANGNVPAEYVPSLLSTSSADTRLFSNGALYPGSNKTDDTLSHPRPLDEAAVIEARRKKREAIKAKHRDPTAPSQPHEAESDTRTSDSLPVPRDELSEQSMIPLPTQLGSDSTQLGPSDDITLDGKTTDGRESPNNLVIEDDYDLADGRFAKAGDNEDGPSAADYDPKMDMQEDRLKQGQREHSDLGSHQEVESHSERNSTIVPPQLAESLPQEVSDGFDMFADMDENDVSSDQVTAVKGIPERVENLTLSQNQAMNAGMLDDWDDADGYYKIILGELIDNRYRVQSNLGRGMFSGVVRATDQKTKSLVAIKVVRNNETMYKAGQKEIDILQSLTRADPEDKRHLVRLERSFEHKGHLCMVFENLSINLREVLKKFGRDIGINLKAVRAYAQQMFLGLGLLRKCNLLHADIKPDNILVNENRNLLKICDLGSASDASENEVTQYLVSRFYRAPEVILGLPFDFGIDMWSVGCTLFELYTGKILFTGRNNNQMLRSMMDCRGKFSHKMLRKAQFAGQHFDDLLNFKSVEQDRLTGRDTVRLLNFSKPTRDLRTRLIASTKGMSEAEVKEVNWFVDLLEKCLNLNPEKRCTPAEALKHPFISRPKT